MKACSKPCKECPFLGKVAGWLGSYEDWDELHRTVMHFERFPCHITMTDKDENLTPEKELICKGSLIYMKIHGKMPRNLAIQKLIDELTPEEIATGKYYKELKEIHSR